MNTHETSVFEPNSPQATEIVNLFYFDLIISAIIFLLVAGLVIYAVFRFRHKEGDPEPFQDPGNTRLETMWTIVPGLILLALLVYTGIVMHSVNPPVGKVKPNVIVVAHQWWWEFKYPNSGVVTANELHMPSGTNWLLQLESADVIHNFWVPNLGAKMDAVPGRINYLWIKPHESGTFIGTCAEYCGTQHALMGILAIVESPEDFKKWEMSQLKAPSPPASQEARRGAVLFETRTCVNCHAIAGTKGEGRVGPDLTHYGDRKTLGSAIFTNNLPNLVKWLQDPQGMKPGVNMPSLQLSQAEAQDLAIYLLELKTAETTNGGKLTWK